MNKIYRSLWNAALGAWVAVPETARTRRGGIPSSKGAARRLGMAMSFALCVGTQPVMAVTLYWDPNGNATGVGGAGTWDVTSNFWNTSASGSGGSLSAWNNAAQNEAALEGAGTFAVSLGAGITVASLNFGASSNYTLSGATLTLAGSNPAINVAGGTQTFTSPLGASNGLIKTGAGTLVFSGGSPGFINPIVGGITINGGVFRVATGNSGSLNNTNLITLANTAGAAFETSSNPTIGGLSGGGSLGGNVRLSAASLNIVNPSDSTYAGILSGDGRIAIQGPFTQTFSGQNTYAGSYLFFGGSLRAGASAGGQAFGLLNKVDFAFNAGNLDLNGFDQTVGALTGGNATGGNVLLGAGTLTLGGDNSSFAYGGSISGSGGLTKVGSGVLTLSGVHSHTGATTVNAGSLRAGAAAGGQAFGNQSAVRLANAAGATLDLNNFAQTVGSLAGGGTTGGNVALGSATLTLAGDNLATENYSGQINGTGSLIKNSAGTQILTGVNTYTGTTTVNGGTLQLGNGSAAGSVVGTVTVNGTGTLALNRSSALTFANVISGNGTLAQTGSGFTTLSGNNAAFSGTTRVSNGGLLVGAGTTLGNLASTVNVTGNGTLGGTGTVGGSVLIDDGILAPGTTAAPGTLNVTGNLGLTANSILNYRLGQPDVVGGALNDLTLVGGNLTLDGALNIIPGTNFGGGVYRLFNYGNQLIDNGLVLGSTPDGTTNVLQTSIAGQVNLVSSVLPVVFWDTALNNNQVNGGTGVWQGAGGNSNWTDENGAVNAPYTDGAFAVFQGVPGTVTVDNSQGQVVSAGMQFDVDGYSVAGGAIELVTGATGIRVGNVTEGADWVAMIASSLIGSGGIDKTDPGTLVLSGNNTYTGGTTISDGTLQLGDGGTSGSVAGNVTNNSTLAFNRSDALAYGGVVSGTGVLSQDGTGTTILTGANTYSGGTTINAGTLQLGNGGTSGSVAGNVTNNATLAFNRSDALAYGGVVSGTGVLRQDGTGTTTLTGANTYSGGTTISAGTLQIGNGGTSGSVAGNVTNDATLALNRSDVFSLAGVVSGTGAVNQLGSGTTILTGANTYSGGTTISVGTLQLGNGGTAGSLVGNVTNNATLAVNRSDAITYDGVVSGTGAVNQMGTGTTILTGINTYSGGTTINAGTLQVGDGGTSGSVAGNVTNNATLVFNRADALTFAGGLSGSGTNMQSGTGVTTLSGNSSTFSGTTQVLNGTLQVDGSLGSAASTLNVSNNAILAGIGTLGGNVSVGDGRLSLGTASTPGELSIGGALVLAGGSLLDYQLGTNAQGDPLNDHLVVGGNLTLDGTLQVSEPVGGTFGPGLYRLISYGGGLTDNGLLLGTTPAGSVNTLQTSVAGEINLINAAGVTVEFWDGNGARNNGAIEGGNGVWQAGGNDNWTGINGNVNAPYLDGIFAIFTGTAGTVTVDDSLGAVVAGGLQFATDGYVLQGAPITLAAGSNDLVVGDGTAQSAGFSATIASALIGIGGVDKTDQGTLILTGNNSYSGGTTISDGILQLGNGGAGGALVGDVLNNGTLVINRSDVATYGGSVSGTGAMHQAGTGTTILTGNNSYSGGTTISVGILQLGDGGTSGSVAGNVTNNATLALNRSDVISYGGVVSGTGTVNQLGTGTTILTGANTYSGGTTINAGTLQIGDGGTVGSLLGNVTNNATLAFNRSDAITFGGVVSGSGSLAQLGSGNTTLSGNSSAFSGNTSVSNGTLLVDGSLGSAASTVSVSNNATLGGTGTLGGDVSIGDGRLTPGTSTTPGTLSIVGDLVLAGGSVLDYLLGSNTVGDPLNDQVDVGGNLTLDGTLNVSEPVGGSFAPGLYRLIDYAGTLIDNGLLLGTQPAGSLNTVQTSVAGQLNLINTAGVTVGFWDGNGARNNGTIEGGDGIWQAAGNDNWTGINGAVNASYPGGIFAIFSGAAGTITIDDSLGAVVSGGLQFATSGYVLQGAPLTLAAGLNDFVVGDGTAQGSGYVATIAASLTGIGGIDKNDEGRLILTGTNTYGGGTTITNGILQLGDGGTAGSLVGNVSNNGTLVFDRSDVAIYGGVVSGTGVVEQAGSGTLILTGENTYTGGTTISAGILQVGDGGTVGSLLGNVANNGTLAFDRSDVLTYGGIVSGTGALSQAGTGTTILSGNNTYTGGTTISAGTLQLGEGGTAGSLVGNVSNNGTLAFHRSDVVTYGGMVSGTGALSQVGTGTTILSGNSTYSGGTTISAGTLQLGDGGTAGSLVGNVANNGTLAFDRADGFTLAGVVSGAGAVNQLGTGTTLLTGANTYSGGTTISAGTLQLGNGGTAGSLVGDVTNNAILALNRTDAFTLAGMVSGTGAVNQVGTGTTIFTGANIYSGGTTITAGTLQLGNGGTAGSLVGDVTNNGTLAVNRADVITYGGVISGTGALHQDGLGTTILTGANSYSGGTTINAGTLQLGNGGSSGGLAGNVLNNATLVLNRADILAFAGSLSGSGSNVQSGTGVTTLSGNSSTFSGTTQVLNGTLQVDGSLGSAASTVSVSNNATLAGIGTLGGNVSVGDGRLSPGTASAPGELSIGGALLLAGGSLLDYQLGTNAQGDPLNDHLVVGGDLTLDGTLQISEPVGGTFGPGLYRLISYGGALTDNGLLLGTTPAGSVNTLQTSVAGEVNLINAAGVTVGFWDGNGAPNNGVIEGGGGVWQAGGNSNWTNINGAINAPYLPNLFAIFSGAPGTITADDSRGALISGGMQFATDGYVLQGASITLAAGSNDLVVGDGTAQGAAFSATITSTLIGSGALDKTDQGTLILTGNNSYSGGTTISDGILQLGNGGTSGSLVGNVTNNATLVFNRSDTLNFSSNISGSGTVVQAGSGTVVLGGNNSYSGGTTIAGGTLQVAGDASLGTASGVLNIDGGTLSTTATMTTGRTINLSGAGGTIDTSSGVLTGNGIVDGAGALTKTGAGTLILTQLNNYQGGTVISAGTLQVGNDASLGATAATLTLNGGTLSASGFLATARDTSLTNAGGTFEAQADDLLHSGTIAGLGRLTKRGEGTLTLKGNNTYSGGTLIAAGTVEITSDSNLGATSGTLTLDGGTLRTMADLTLARSMRIDPAGGTLDIQAATQLLTLGSASGVGALSKTGGGSLILGADNSYTGGTLISEGLLQVGNGGTTGSVEGNISNNSQLAFHRADAVAFEGVISGSGRVTKLGTGTLTLSGPNTYSGGTQLKMGQISVGHATALGSGTLAMDEGTTLGFTEDALNLANAIELTGTTDPLIDTGNFTETLSGSITGAGALTKVGDGVLILAGRNSYSGATNVAQGTLRAGVADTFSADSTHAVAPGATLDTAGFNQQLAALSNSGTVSLASAQAGSTLTVTGPYAGGNGSLRLGTGLAGAVSVSDRLVLNGPSAHASGNTTIQISDLSGLGALTRGNGIEVVSASNGATTTAQSTKDAFNLAGGHVDAGAYEYRLYAADADGSGENWYLRSAVTTPPGGGSGGEGGTGGENQIPIYRSEVPLLTALPAQIRQGDLAMLGNLHRRMGDEESATSRSARNASADADDLRESWVRVVYGNLDISQSSVGQAQSDGHVSGVQAGTDLWANANWRMGVYLGSLAGSANISGQASGQNGRVGSTDLDANYLGAYATWRDNQGWYVDSVLQGASHQYDINPDNAPNKSGKAKSYAASVETGKAYPLTDQWSIEPQAQLVFQHSNFDKVNLSGARVDLDAGDGWVARVGVRVKGDLPVEKLGRVQPYGRVNLYKANYTNDHSTFAGPAGSTDLGNNGNYTSGEVAAGGTVALNSTMDLYGEVGHVWNISGDTSVESDVQASIGVRLRW